MSFKTGDRVWTKDWGDGIIVRIFPENCEALVEITTDNGGGCLPFGFEELKHAPKRTATLKAFKSVHGTANVIVQNCSLEIVTLLHRFDVWNSHGNYKYNENKPEERPEIWFECPIEFLDFVESNMGRAAFEHMGVEEFYINSNVKAGK